MFMFTDIFYTLLVLLPTVFASNGDISGAFQSCLQPCQKNCSEIGPDQKQPLFMKLMGWNCMEECKYQCMWVAVDIYAQHKVPCPQFYGKWPFVRVLGMQEPASVLFSILNGVSNIIGYRNYRASVPSSSPMFRVTTVHFIVDLNAWIWSSVFHARDYPWTEKLDYFFATSLVVYAFYVVLHRWTYETAEKKRTAMRWLAGFVLATLYLGHVTYLSVSRFDYGYNMKANIGVGLSNSACWLFLCAAKRKTCPYFWKIPLLICLTNCFLAFEVFDFVPLWWTFDAHSIWHMLTVPLPIVLFSFFKDDHLFLHREAVAKLKIP